MGYVVREAVIKMIDDYKRQQAVRKAEKIYKEIEADDKRLAEEFLSICLEGNSREPWFEGVLEVIVPGGKPAFNP